MKKLVVLFGLLASFMSYGFAVTVEKNGLWLRNYEYPYPVKIFDINEQNQPIEMAYMDVKPDKPNGQTVLLFHGKNFVSAYWEKVIAALVKQGYRVIAADQVGFGKSSKPSNFYYTFQIAAQNTKQLLESLKIKKVNVIGHSMGGMFATRFTLMYPGTVNKLILEDPLGLEDYRILEPFVSVDKLYQANLNTTPDKVEAYQKNYFVNWKSEYGKWGKLQAEQLAAQDAKQLAWVSALLYQMIYTQPDVYEYPQIKVPTLFIVGEEDRTAPGKARVPKDIQAQLGNFPVLAKDVAAQMDNSQVVIIADSGHIPHMEQYDEFIKNVGVFLSE